MAHVSERHRLDRPVKARHLSALPFPPPWRDFFN
jgi:hypothetical protein